MHAPLHSNHPSAIATHDGKPLRATGMCASVCSSIYKSIEINQHCLLNDQARVNRLALLCTTFGFYNFMDHVIIMMSIMWS